MRKLSDLVPVFVLIVLVVVLCHRYQELDSHLILRTADESTIIEQVEETEPEPTEVTESVKETEPPEQSKPPAKSPSKYADDEDYTGFVGRLHVPDAGIDVALYRGSSQSITDRGDSANLFRWKDYSGEVIADHSNQDFSKLFYVDDGTTGYIQLADGTIINIVCVSVINGHNTGYELTDESDASVMGMADYVMYTCRDGWQNVRICLWDII